MMKTQKNRSKKLKALGDEQANALNDQLEKYLDLQALANSEGGKLLISNAKKDVLGSIEILGNTYSTATHTELVTACATLKARLDLLRTLTRAETNKEITEKELDEMLENTLDE